MRTGSDYLRAREESPLEVWLNGQRVRPFSIPKLRRQAQVIADYYDHHLRDRRTHVVDDPNGAYAMTLLPPTSRENLERKAASYSSLARNYLGILGRPPDYINVVLSTWEAQADLFGEYAQNLRAYVAAVRRNDWFVTHTTSELKGGAKSGIRIVDRTTDGLVLSGARAMATSAALCDEMLIAPTRLIDGEADKAVICAVPSHIPGLKFVCRENIEGYSELSNNFDESDALIILENVVVPWNRVFACGDLDAYRNTVKQTGTSLACSLQTNARAMAKLELMIELLGSWREIFPRHPQQRLPQTMGLALRDLRILKALQAEALAKSSLQGSCWQPHDESIEAAKFYFMESYPKLIHRLREDLGPDLFYLFRADEVDDSIRAELCRQWGITEEELNKRQRVSAVLFDLLASSFGVRQELYEQFYAGNPHQGIANYWANYGARRAAVHALEKCESFNVPREELFDSLLSNVEFAEDRERPPEAPTL